VTVKDRVFKVVSKVMRVPLSKINNDSSPDTVDNWDSLQQMNLIMALEEEFDVQFTDKQIVELLNVQLIILDVQSILNSKKCKQ